MNPRFRDSRSSQRRLALFVPARRLLTFLLFVGMSGVCRGQLPPEEAARQVVAAAGLRVQLFAHEPQLYAPTAIDVDEQGRVWVVEGVNYRQAGGPRINEPPYFPNPLRKTGDRVVVLEDADGDGRCDKSRVFYEGLDVNSPQGFAVFGGKVWISQSPSIRTIDINADGSAGKVQTLLTGFGGIHGDHSVHSVYLGPDGKLYSCFGNTHTVLTLPDGKKIDNWASGAKGGVVFRMNLDTTGFEVLGDNFRNGYESATDSFGTTFYSDNDDDEGNLYCRFVYVMPGGNFGHQPQPPRGFDWNMERPGVVPILMRTGAGAPAGLCIYEGKLLPERFRGMPILAETGTGELLGFHLTPDGAGYRVAGAAVDEHGRQTIDTLRQTRKPDVLLRSNDRWFRPSDAAVAPDGSLFVADFYNHVAGGRKLDDEWRGRIYHIVPAGHDGSYRPPSIDVDADDGLVAALGSPNLAARAAAVQRLTAMGDAARPLLEKHLAADDPRIAARVLYRLAALGEAGRARVKEALADDNPDIRVTAVRALAINGGISIDVLRPLARDKSPQVRREVLLALRTQAASDAAVELIVDLALQFDGFDRFYLESLLLAVGGKDMDRARGAIVEKIRGRADRAAVGLLWALRNDEALTQLVGTAADAGRPGAERAVAAEWLALYDKPSAGEALLKLIDADAPAEAAAPLAAPPDLLARIQPWIENERSRDDALRLATALGTRPLTQWRLSPAIPAPQAEGFASVFPPEQSEAPERAGDWSPARAAGGGIVDLAAQRRPNSNAVCYAVTLIHAAEPLETRLLAGSDDGIKVWLNGALIHAKDTTRGVGPRQDVAAAQFRQGVNRLMVKINQGTGGWGFVVEVEDPVGALTEVTAAEASQLADPSDRLDPRKLPPDAELLALEGDAGRGRGVFLRATTACAKCHAVGGQGAKTTALGPALDGVGQKMGRDALLESIIRPEAKIAPQWVTWTIATSAGKTYTGLIAEETPERLVLVDAAGRRTAIAKGEIEAKKQGELSIMPQELIGNVTPQELADLLEFLLRS
jgi:putative membrane-bound dehydrogenase-like protein